MLLDDRSSRPATTLSDMQPFTPRGPFDKDLDHPNRIILSDPVFQAFGKQRALAAIYPLNEALHPIPPQIAQDQRVFTQPGSFASVTQRPRARSSAPTSDP